MKNKEIIKFSFLLSGGEEITKIMEVRGADTVDFVGIRRYGERYAIQIGPHTIDLPATLMKDIVEKILLIYPDDEDLQEVIESLLQDKPWIFDKIIRK